MLIGDDFIVLGGLVLFLQSKSFSSIFERIEKRLIGLYVVTMFSGFSEMRNVAQIFLTQKYFQSCIAAVDNCFW